MGWCCYNHRQSKLKPNRVHIIWIALHATQEATHPQYTIYCWHDDVIEWKKTRHWPFLRGIHRSPVNSPHICQWRGALMFSLIYTWINGWVNNGEAGDLRRHRAHYDVTVIKSAPCGLLEEFGTRRISHHYENNQLLIFVTHNISIDAPKPRRQGYYWYLTDSSLTTILQKTFSCININLLPVTLNRMLFH